MSLINSMFRSGFVHKLKVIAVTYERLTIKRSLSQRLVVDASRQVNRDVKNDTKKEVQRFDTTMKTIQTIREDLVPKSVLGNIKISRYFPGPTKLPEMSLTLFQYQTCPFCCKVRVFLDYYGVEYNLVEVNPVTRSQTKFSKYRKVPFVLFDKKGENDLLQLNDSSVIVSILSSFMFYNKNPKEDLRTFLKSYKNNAFYKDENEEKQVDRYFLMIDDKQFDPKNTEERTWRQWADDVLIHTLAPNIYRNFDESLNSLKYFSKVGNWDTYFRPLERLFVIYFGAFSMLFVSKRLKKKYALKNDVRQSLYDECNVWLKAIGEHRKFMGGSKPNLADLTVYGMMSSIEGCDAFKDVLRNTNVGPWFYAVKQCCEQKTGHSDVPLKN